MKSAPVKILARHAEKCRTLGIDFIVVVLPDSLREADPLLHEMTQSGIKTVAFMPTKEYPQGADLERFWQKEDSHWTKDGVQETANRVVQNLQIGNPN